MPKTVKINITKCLLGLSLIAVLSGCGKPVLQNELVGVYLADYPVAKEKLTLFSDGKFIQQVTIKSNSQTFSNNGTWTFDAADTRVAFHDNFITVLDGFGQPKKQPESGTAVLPVVRWLGKVQIGDDPSIEYKKQPKS